MSGNLFTLPNQVALDSNGDHVNGAKAFFYKAGTLTLQNTFTTATLAVAHANPVVADSGGVFVPIFLDDRLDYRMILKTSADVTLQDEDDLTAPFGKAFGSAILVKSANYTVTAGDRGQFIDASGTITITLLAAATAGIGFPLGIKNNGSGVVTVDGNAAETIDSGTSVDLDPGQSIIITSDGSNWVSLGQTFNEQIKIKTADESVTNSDTLQDDDHLSGFAISAGTFYTFEAFLYALSASATPDIQIVFPFTQTPQLSRYAIQVSSADQAPVLEGDISIMTSAHGFGLITGSVDQGFIIRGFFQSHATLAGTMKLQWAQSTSDATPTTLKAGSWMRIRKIPT